MIFILTESTMNGTITMDVITTLIESDSFEGAYEKLKNFPNWKLATNIKESNEGVQYWIQDGMFGCGGRLKRMPAKVV
jgi:hypothetical protein